MQKVVLYVLLFFLIGCDFRYSKDAIPELPQINADFREKALIYLDEQIEKNPEDIDLYLEKLKLYDDQGWPLNSIRTINASIEIDRANVSLYKFRKDYYIKHGNYRKALTDIDYLIQKTYAEPNLLLQKVEILFRLNRFDEALQLLNSKELLSIDHPKIYRIRSEIFLAQGDTLLALRNLYLHYERNKQHEAVNNKLINLLIKTKHWKKAEEVMNELASADSAYAMEAAIIQLKLGKYEKAIPTLQYFAQNGNNNALQELSDYYFNFNKFDSVIYQNNYYISHYDSSNTAFMRIGKAYDRKGWWSTSLNYYEIVLATDSTHQEALQEISKVKGKIAYLRRLKEERERTRTNIVIPKKKLEF